MEDIGTAAAEVIEDCYADSENERDPHTAPDWCEQKANTVAKAVAKRPSLAAEVLVYAAYERGGRVDGSSFEPVAKPPVKTVDRSAWLAQQLLKAADPSVVVWRIQQLLEKELLAAAPQAELRSYLLAELSAWTGWRVCQLSSEFPGDAKVCAKSWRGWLAIHGAEKPGQWQESAAAARLADLRSGDPPRQSWALEPWHRLGRKQRLGAAYLPEVAWILHDALLPNRLTAEQADHFVELALSYDCPTRCVLFPPPLAGRTLPPAPLTLAEGKPVMVTLPARPVDASAQWTVPAVPKELTAKVARGVKRVKAYVVICMDGTGVPDDGGAACYDAGQALEAFMSDGLVAAHMLARGYFLGRPKWSPLPLWHTSGEQSIIGYSVDLQTLAKAANQALLVDYLLAAYPRGPEAGIAKAKSDERKRNILIQLAELAKIPLCGAVPWSQDGEDQCFGQWSAWWLAHRQEDPAGWQNQGAAMQLADLQSDELARRYNALAYYQPDGELAQSTKAQDVAVRWSLRDVLLNPATPPNVASAFDAVAAGLRCNFRCVAFPPPLAGRQAPALPALVAQSRASLGASPGRAKASAAEGAAPAELLKVCRSLLMRLEAEQALEVCGKGAALDPNHAELQIALAWATLDARDAGAAVVAAQRAVAVSRGSALAKAQLVLGAALTAAGEKAKAQVTLLVAAADRSTAAEATARLAMLDGKTPSGKALPRLVHLVHCAGQAKLADPEALLVRRGWLAGLPAWQAAVKNVAVGRCGS